MKTFALICLVCTLSFAATAERPEADRWREQAGRVTIFRAVSMEPSHAGSNPVCRLVVPHPPTVTLPPVAVGSCTSSHAASRPS